MKSTATPTKKQLSMFDEISGYIPDALVAEILKVYKLKDELEQKYHKLEIEYKTLERATQPTLISGDDTKGDVSNAFGKFVRAIYIFADTHMRNLKSELKK